MSAAALDAFITLVAEDESLRTRLATTAEPGAFAEACAREASQRGITLEARAVLERLQGNHLLWLQRHLA